MTYQTFEFTAFYESDLLQGDDWSLGWGDSFTMPGAPTVTLSVTDNDHHLSGDYGGRYDRYDVATDWSGQYAKVDGQSLGCRSMYVEKTWTLQGSDGKLYLLAEIEVEHHNAAGRGDDYFTFVGHVPPAGVTLNVLGCRNVCGEGIKYDDLGATPPEPEPTDGVTCVVDFENFDRGQKVNQLDDTVSVYADAGGAMIFDTDNISGGDNDLQGGDGNVLIISEDGDSSDPDDNACGGRIQFSFNEPVAIDSLTVVDTEEGGVIRVFDADWNWLRDVSIPRIGDGQVRDVDIGVQGASFLVVKLKGSGAVDNLTYTKPAPETGSLSGRYFCDEDGDALDNDGPANGVAGVLVALLDAAGNEVRDAAGNAITTVTDDQGNYSFGDLVAGTYGVKFTDTVSGKVLVAPNADNNSNDDIDSDATDIGNGMSMIEGIVVVAGQDTPDNDAGVVDPNTAPKAMNDTAATCTDEVVRVDVLANDSDADGDAITISMVDGQSIAENVTITTSAGTMVTLVDGQLIINGASAYMDLDIGQATVETISYQITDSAGATATANIDVTFKGDANSVASFADSLPDGLIEYQLRSGALEPFDADGFELQFGVTGDARFDGLVFEQAYCLSILDPADTAANFDAAPLLTAEMFASREAPASLFNANQTSVANGQSAADNLDLVNWILIQDFENNGFTGWEVQRAIWELTDSFDTDFQSDIDPIFGDDAQVDFLVAEAIANGEGFEAGVGDVIGVIIDPNPVTAENSQPFIVAMTFEDFDCLCGPDDFVFV